MAFELKKHDLRKHVQTTVLALARLLACHVGCCFFSLVVPLSAASAMPPTTSYHIGNSLTADSQPLGVAAIAALQGLDHTSGFHIRSGFPLNEILSIPDDPSVESVPEFGTFDSALPSHEWDFVTMQPHPSTTPLSNLGTDVASAVELIDLTRSNPANADTAFYIYSAWPSFINFRATWLAPAEDSLTKQTIHSRDYYKHFIERLRMETDAEVHMIPVGDVLLELDNRIEAGDVPGINSLFGFYRDAIHLKRDIGRYVASVTTFTTLFGLDPSGQTKPEGFFGSDDAFSPELYDVIHETVRLVVATHPYADVVLPLPTTADFNSNGQVDGPDLAEWHSSFGVEIDADTDLDHDVDGADFLAWQRSLTIYAGPDFNKDTVVTTADLQIWESSLGNGDGADADGDGDSDGADFLRWQRDLAPIAVADFDRNGFVDGDDLSQWGQAFGLDDQGDIDGDGDSDGADFLAWQRTNTSFEITDFDQDHVVDGSDLAIWGQSVGQHQRGDADQNRIVNGADFLAWQREFGWLSLAPQPATSAATVPEPCALILMLAAILYPVARGNRKLCRTDC